MFLVVSLVVSVFGALNVNMMGVSAVEYPAIYVDPPETWDTGLEPGDNYTISIKTNYTGDDIWGYQFGLSYNPNVLHGGVNKTDTWTGNGGQRKFYTTYTPVLKYSEYVYLNGSLQTIDVDYKMDYLVGEVYFKSAPGVDAEVKATYLYGVVNGDLITGEDEGANFEAGTFNETLGELSLTGGWFFYMTPEDPNVTSGPGILAYVTFTVVGYGFSDITLGGDTKLIGYNFTTHSKYDIIYAKFDVDHIQHGYFNNKILGDVNGDQTVNASDLSDFSEAYGSEPADPNCDFNRDNKVDASDLFDLSKNYGKSI